MSFPKGPVEMLGHPYFTFLAAETDGGWCTQLCLTFCDPWTIAHQTSLSTEFSRQKYWSGLPFPPPGDLPDPGTEPASPALQEDSL